VFVGFVQIGVATSDVLKKILMSDVLSTNLMFTELLFFFKYSILLRYENELDS